ncbi:MAG: hypothetical protein V3R41_06540 [Gammaproteobacteria bacterium]
MTVTLSNISAGIPFEITDLVDKGTPILPNFPAFSFSSTGDNTIVAAVPGKRIKVVQIMMTADAQATVKFTDGAGGSVLCGPQSMVEGVPLVFPFCSLGWMITSVNTAFVVNFSDATNIGGCVCHLEF